MADIDDIRAFLVSASAGSFAAAGRDLEIAAPAVTKRVDRLESRIGARLFQRTTRRLTLTSEGERVRPLLQTVFAEFEQAVRAATPDCGSLRGHLRIKSPTTVGNVVGASLLRFGGMHPGLMIEMLLIDRAVNPIEEGFDVAVGALPMSFASVVDIPLCPYERILVASPDYLSRRPMPRHPSELAHHEALVFLPNGLTGSFESGQGSILVQLRARFAANDSRVLHDAALQGLGVATLPRFLARGAVAEGLLVEILPDYPPSPIWFKAMVPSNKVHNAEVAALLDHLKEDFAPVPPWDR